MGRSTGLPDRAEIRRYNPPFQLLPQGVGHGSRDHTELLHRPNHDFDAPSDSLTSDTLHTEDRLGAIDGAIQNFTIETSEFALGQGNFFPSKKEAMSCIGFGNPSADLNANSTSHESGWKRCGVISEARCKRFER